MRIPLLVLPLALTACSLASCALTPAERQQAADQAVTTQVALDRQVAGLTADKPTDCMDNIRQQSQTIGYGSTILYKVSRNLIYRTDTSGGCEGIARGDALITVTPSDRFCRGDIARTVDLVSRIPTGSCALGSFVKYHK